MLEKQYPFGGCRFEVFEAENACRWNCLAGKKNGYHNYGCQLPDMR